MQTDTVALHGNSAIQHLQPFSLVHRDSESLAVAALALSWFADIFVCVECSLSMLGFLQHC